MQDNPFDKKFMDEAWRLMDGQLNEVMPQERKRRFVFWWWFLPSLGLSAVLLGLFLPNLNWIINQTQNDPIPTEKSSSKEPIAAVETNPLQSQQTAIIIDNNPNIPNGQDPVATYSIKVPDASVLHTATEIPQSEQQVSEVEPATDLRFLSPVDVLNSKIGAPSYLSLSTSLTQAEMAKPKGLLFRRGTAAVFVASAYETQQSNLELAVGLGWKQQKGRFFLRLEPGFHTGTSVISAQPVSSAENAMDNPSTSTNLDPGAEPISGVNNLGTINVDFQYLNLEVPLTLGYYLNEKWSMEAGLQWTKSLQFKELNSLDNSILEALRYNSNPNFNSNNNQSNFNFNDLLRNKSWLEGRLGLNYQLSTRFEMQAAYRIGSNNRINSNQFDWTRNHWSLRMRYRIR